MRTIGLVAFSLLCFAAPVQADDTLETLWKDYQAYGLPTPSKGAQLAHLPSPVLAGDEPTAIYLVLVAKIAQGQEPPVFWLGCEPAPRLYDTTVKTVPAKASSLAGTVPANVDELAGESRFPAFPDLALAIQSYGLGWKDVATALLARSRERRRPVWSEADLPRPRADRTALAELAWFYYCDEFVGIRCDRKPVVERLKKLLAAAPGLDTKARRNVIADMEKTLVAVKTTPKSPEAYLESFLEFDGGGVDELEREANFVALRKLGVAAVPLLMKHRDDFRLTRLVQAHERKDYYWFCRIADVVALLLNKLALQPFTYDFLEAEGRGVCLDAGHVAAWWKQGAPTKPPEEPAKPFFERERSSRKEPDFATAIQNGDVELVKTMLAKEPKLATTMTWALEYPIQLAARHLNLVIAEILIAAGVEPDIDSAVELGLFERVRAMVKDKPWLVKAPNRPLAGATLRGRRELVRFLLERGADPNFASNWGTSRYTALTDAVQNADFEIAKLLCEHGAKTDVSIGKAGDNLFHFAVADREPRFVKLMLEHGADPEALNEYGVTPLHVAASVGALAKVKLLLDHKASINVTTHDGATPLFMAAACEHREVCEHLLSHGAKLDVYSACALGKTAEVEAMLKANPKLINAKDARVERTLLFWAAQNGDAKLVKLLLARGADVRARASYYVKGGQCGAAVLAKDEPGDTPLHVAAAAGRTDAVRLLVENGADVAAKGISGWLPLQEACARHHRAVVEELLKRTDLRNQKDLGVELLFAAIKDKECVRLLLDAGADPNSVTGERDSPLLTAAYDEQRELVELLLARGAKLDLHTACVLGRLDDVKRLVAEAPKQIDAELRDRGSHNNETPLILAARAGHLPIVEFLASKGAKYKDADFKYYTPMRAAARNGRVTLVDWFISKGVDAGPALLVASGAGQVEVVRFLLAKKVSVESEDQSRWTALHAVGGPSPAAVEIARLLIEHGARVDARDKRGQTPLHSTAYYGQVGVATLLLAKGADINARDHHGWTPLWYARNFNRDEPERRSPAMIELLVKQGGRD